MCSGRIPHSTPEQSQESPQRLAVAKMARDAVASLFAAIADGGEISVSDLVPVIKAAPLTVTERSHALEKVEDLN